MNTTFIVLILAVGLVCGEKMMDKIIKHIPEEDIKACAEETGVNISDGVVQGIRELLQAPDGRQKFPCFAKCVMQKSKFVTDDGTIDVKAVEDQIPEFKELDENTKKSVSECFEKTGKIVECDDILKLVACMPNGMA